SGQRAVTSALRFMMVAPLVSNLSLFPRLTVPGVVVVPTLAKKDPKAPGGVARRLGPLASSLLRSAFAPVSASSVSSFVALKLRGALGVGVGSSGEFGIVHR